MIPPRCALEVWLRSGVGGRDPYACWVVLLPDGRLHVCAEMLFRRQVIGQVAATILRVTHDTVTPRLHTRWTRTIGDAALFPKKDGVIGESPAETCRKAGLFVLKGDDQEAFGWQRLKHWFLKHPSGEAWLTIDPDCVFMARTLPTLIEDATDPDVIAEAMETQAAHALRVGVMARPSPSVLDIPHIPVHPDAIRHLLRKELSVPQTFGIVR